MTHLIDTLQGLIALLLLAAIILSACVACPRSEFGCSLLPIAAPRE